MFKNKNNDNLKTLPYFLEKETVLKEKLPKVARLNKSTLLLKTDNGNRGTKVRKRRKHKS